jgi:hypothetical protein
MKVSFGMNLQSGPWGGGNQFGHTLRSYLEKRSSRVYFDLSEPDLDIIVLTEPRSNLTSSAYSHEQIVNYLKYRNEKAIVIHRINECDERKGTDNVNELLMEANRCADHTVFISSFLENLFAEKTASPTASSVILNGGNTYTFNRGERKKRTATVPLKLVTHHWGGNWLKGFDIYQRLDRMLSGGKWSDRISFTYIGTLPEGFKFRNAKYIEPLSGDDLADKLRLHHIYLTASRNEPAGMHHIEGALCGLPLMYIESGALPEYCNDFGISFTPDNFVEKLEEMIETFDHWAEKIPSYPHTAEKMCNEYYTLFRELLDKRDQILARRKPITKPSLIERTSYHFEKIKGGMRKSVRQTARKVLGKA